MKSVTFIRFIRSPMNMNTVYTKRPFQISQCIKVWTKEIPDIPVVEHFGLFVSPEHQIWFADHASHIIEHHACEILNKWMDDPSTETVGLMIENNLIYPDWLCNLTSVYDHPNEILEIRDELINAVQDYYPSMQIQYPPLNTSWYSKQMTRFLEHKAKTFILNNLVKNINFADIPPRYVTNISNI